MIKIKNSTDEFNSRLNRNKSKIITVRQVHREYSDQRTKGKKGIREKNERDTRELANF